MIFDWQSFWTQIVAAQNVSILEPLALERTQKRVSVFLTFLQLFLNVIKYRQAFSFR